MRQVFGFSVAVLVLALAGCSKEGVQSDVVVGQVFDNLNAALTYDDVCADGAAVKSVNPNLFGNMQTIAYLFSQELGANHPDIKPDELQKAVFDRRDSVSEKAATMLRDKGCDSDEAQKAKAALDLFLTVSPPQTYASIEAKVKSVGSALHPAKDGKPATAPQESGQEPAKPAAAP